MSRQLSNVGMPMPKTKQVDAAGGHLRTPTEAELLSSTTAFDKDTSQGGGLLIDVSRS